MISSNNWFLSWFCDGEIQSTLPFKDSLFGHIPIEIINTLILPELSFKDVCIVQLVCKDLNKLARDEMLWKLLCKRAQPLQSSFGYYPYSSWKKYAKSVLKQRIKFEPGEKVLFKCIVVGSSDVGKTSLNERFIYNRFVYKLCTSNIRPDFSVKSIFCGNRKVELQVWDTLGQERYQSIGRYYYRGVDIVLFVYDVTKYKSLKELYFWFEELKNSFGTFYEKRIKDIIFILVGNKIDLLEPGNFPPFHEEVIELYSFLNSNTICFHILTSAKDGTGVSTIFEKAANLALSKVVLQEKMNKKKEIHMIKIKEERVYGEKKCLIS